MAITLNVAQELETHPVEVWRLLLASYEFEFPATPLFEEFVFRGVVFAGLLEVFVYAALGQYHVDPKKSALLTWRAAWSANLLATIVFVGAHWPYWIFTDGLGASLIMKSLPVFLLSLVLGMLFARGRSIWPCVLLHWINNELSALVSG
jgi:membrane protease YdiL (CAAX protease family)